jgi:hypothetical protein
MHVLQFAKRAVLAVAAGAVLTGCSSSAGPTPFNPAGATADMQAANAAFNSPAFASFSSQSILFDAALGGAPLVSTSAAALDTRAGGSTGLHAAAARSGELLARMIPRAPNQNFSASSAAIQAAYLGKTFVYSGGVYVVSDLSGAPSNGVRFLLYAVDPITFQIAEPLNQTGYVDLTDLSSGATSAARVVVVSGGTTYLNYTVSASSSLTSGRVTVQGFVTDGTTQANFNLRATLNFDAGLTLVYGLDVPQRDLSIDLTLTASDLTATGTIGVDLALRGGNGWVSLTGQMTADGGTLTVRVNGDVFATITATVTGPPVITGASGQPLAPEEYETLQHVFDFTDGSFTAFDELMAPAGTLIGG